MIVRDMAVALKVALTQWYREIFVDNQKNGNFLNNILIILVAFGFIWGGYNLYKYYMYSREATAQKVLTECIAEFDKAKGGMGSWLDVEVALDMAYKQNSGSKLAPYFLAFKADAMHNQGKTKEAIEQLQISLNKMDKESGMFGAFSAKLALMKLDAQDEALQKEGLAELQVASEKDNSGQGVALFYLGSYYWGKDDFVNAKEAWSKLVALSGEKEDAPLSPYARMAKEKLELID